MDREPGGCGRSGRPMRGRARVEGALGRPRCGLSGRMRRKELEALPAIQREPRTISRRAPELRRLLKNFHSRRAANIYSRGKSEEQTVLDDADDVVEVIRDF